MSSNSLNDILSQLMNTSKVTDRGYSYNSKSKSGSRVISYNQSVPQNQSISNYSHHPSRFSSIITAEVQTIKQRQSLAVLQNIEERTNRKIPIFKEIDVNMKRNETKSPKGLLQNQLSKRTFNQFEIVKMTLLHPQILKQNKLQVIREEKDLILQNRVTNSSIDTEIANRMSYSTDISED